MSISVKVTQFMKSGLGFHENRNWCATNRNGNPVVGGGVLTHCYNPSGGSQGPPLRMAAASGTERATPAIPPAR